MRRLILIPLLLALCAAAFGQSMTFWVAGDTNSTTFPVTNGSTQQNATNGNNGILSAITRNSANTSSTLTFSTYLGGAAGTGVTQIRALWVDPVSGDVFAGGRTSCHTNLAGVSGSGGVACTFPVNGSGVFQPVYAGGVDDAIICRFKNDGTQKWCSYLGTSSSSNPEETVYSIAGFDGSGNLAVCGRMNYIANGTAFNGINVTRLGPTPEVGDQAYCAKIKPDGSAMVWYTGFGGTGADGVRGRSVMDSNGNIYGEGDTESTDFPVTTGTYQTTNRSVQSNHGEGDAFELKTDGTSLIWATYIGGSGYNVNDVAEAGIVLDTTSSGSCTSATPCLYLGINTPGTSNGTLFFNQNSGHATGYLKDWTSSGTGSGGTHYGACIVMHLSNDGKTMLHSTFLSGNAGGFNTGSLSTDTQCANIILDNSGNVFVYGSTSYTDFPTTVGAYQTTVSGTNLLYGFVSEFSSDLSTLVASTYIGNTCRWNNTPHCNSIDNSGGIGFDSNQNIYGSIAAAVRTGQNTAWPTTSDAYNGTFVAQGNDIVIFGLSHDLTTLKYGTFLAGAVGTGYTSVSAGNYPWQMVLTQPTVTNNTAALSETVTVTDSLIANYHSSHATGTISDTVTISDAVSILHQTPPPFDIYGGRPAITCTDGNAPNGWGTQLITSRWWLCDPLGNGYIMQGVSISTGRTGTGYVNTAIAKYGDAGATWGPKQVGRFENWGFNAVGPASDNSVLPTNQTTDQVPMLAENLAASQYPGVNLWGYGTHATHDLVYGTDLNWNSLDTFRAYLADVFDPSYATWWGGDITNQSNAMGQAGVSPWVIGFAWDDVDFMWGLGAGPDFNSVPSGHSSTNVAFTVALTAPNVTANFGNNGNGSYRRIQTLYSDPKVYAKVAMASPPTTCNVTTPCSLRDYLSKKYSATIASLNTAWGSAYTTFDSSGTTVTSESLGTGDGTTTTFTKTLATGTHTSPYSFAVYVAGVQVAGDCPWFTVNQGCAGTAHTGIVKSALNVRTNGGQFYQPTQVVGAGYVQQLTGTPANTFCLAGNSAPAWNTTVGGTTTDGTCTWTNKGASVAASSTINYGTKAVSITFAVAPAAAVAITVNYIADGWTYGTGLMDEDGGLAAGGAAVYKALNSNMNGVCLIAPNLYGGVNYSVCQGVHTPSMNATAGADLDGWTKQFAGEYFKTVTTQIKNVVPKVLLFGADTLGTWGVPPHVGWLTAASQYLDVAYIQSFATSPAVGPIEGAAINNAYINNLTIPIIENNGNVQSGQDSPDYQYSQTANIGLFNQEQRGSFFLQDWNYKFFTANNSGNLLYVGFNYFPAIDFQSSTEAQDWGFIDSFDNPYDGIHACIAGFGSSTESITGTNYTRTDEPSFTTASSACTSGTACILPDWQALTAYTTPVKCNVNPCQANTTSEILTNVGGTTYMFQPTKGGTSGGSAPTWCTTLNCAVLNDGTVNWINMGSKASSTCWGNQITSVQTATGLWVSLTQQTTTPTVVPFSPIISEVRDKKTRAGQ